ncbi:DUF2283 domain-containing protein [Candidatus Gottesmanbacteria bacterium]|nr:DUF2283 domain-containing protein [Candidatus Gottesmanbacteria bacterium]MBI5452407.1 DUF2283 domain-containing protein [Candidatus Gottesmanbacteria bacterium]
MKVKYDSKIDALYIDLSEGKYEKTKKITDSILVDLTHEGKVLGIEILDASENIKHFDPQELNISLQLNNLSSRQI